ncbi:MAG: Gfo/Idh/MocA family oxidoreductase, partial [Gammaproteobacteria bacterium]|nr:Gfo/Idh/MocA family oxidoreductase [Gammaproteobacteria bacterium]
EYEDRGIDYPYPFVRWTQGRNLEGFLNIVADGRVQIAPLTSHTFDVAMAPAAYELLQSASFQLGILLEYPQPLRELPVRTRVHIHARKPTDRVSIGIIGPGSHVRDRLLPPLRASNGAVLHAVCSKHGPTGRRVADEIGASYCASDYREILADTDINAVLIGTQHDSHARIVCDALAAGKHVFVEKPLALSQAELADVAHAYEHASARRNTALLVGFNRRHSPHLVRTAEFFARRTEPLTMVYRINAGALDPNHWVHRQGGRLLGEICHFIDALSVLAGAPQSVHALRTRGAPDTDNDYIVNLTFADGSVGTIAYAVRGDNSVSKERLEVFGQGQAAIVDDYAVTSFHGGGRKRHLRTRPRDKGFAAQMAHFVTLVGQDVPGGCDWATAHASTLATLQAQASLEAPHSAAAT